MSYISRALQDYPIGGERHLSFSRQDVLAAAGSRYGPTATLVDFSSVLERGRPFAFIGKSCDISALRNYARHEPRLDELCQYFLTLVCGGFGEPPYTPSNSFVR